MKVVLTAVFALVAGILVPNAAAQFPQLNPVAVQMAQAISKSKQDSVIVIDFSGPGARLNALGQNLAQDFSDALAKANPSLRMMDRSKISARCAEHSLSLSALSEPSLAIWIAQDLGAKTIVLGKLAISDNNLTITLSAYQVENARGIAGLKTTLSLSSEMRALIDREIPETSNPWTEAVHIAGKGGVGYPQCKRCSFAPYTEDALKHQIRGTVTMEAIIGTDGRAHNISIYKGLEYGLTRQAVIAVTGWTFTPALDSDGKPVPARQVIEVTFHLP